MEYTVEPAPERFFNSVDVLRVRPLTRRGVMALQEAVFVRKRRTRGGTANVFALCPDRDGAFYFVRFGAILHRNYEQERKRCRFMKNWLPVA